MFSFATRLTRLTPALAAASPDTMLAKAGEAAPDWSGGTRIGAALKEFNDHYGCRGMARGAVVLIISDGWETGDPELLGEQMARLSRVALPDRLGQPAHSVPALPPRGRRHGRRLAVLRRRGERAQLDALDDLLAALAAPLTRSAAAARAAGRPKEKAAGAQSGCAPAAGSGSGDVRRRMVW